MALQDKTDENLKLIDTIALSYIDSYELLLYGSRARKDFSEGSDIDVALRCQDRIDPLLLSELKAEIDDSSLPVLIDLVDYHAVSDKMKSQIDKDGIVWKR